MEQYLNANVKRFVQKQLFKKVSKVKTVLGLGGLHPEKYIEVLLEHKNCVLVDFNPVNALVRRNSLIGEFDLLIVLQIIVLSTLLIVIFVVLLLTMVQTLNISMIKCNYL